MHHPAIQATTSLSMAEAELRLREALKQEGFGILTEVDVQTVLKEKVGADVDPYRILGVCNPALAQRALQLWKGFGLIAPCNVALYEAGGHRIIIAFDPASVPEVRDNAELYEVARAASAGIGRAVRSLDET